MPNELRPKHQFQTHESIKKELGTVVHSDNFHFSLSFALSEFVTRTTPNAEQLSAVRAFILVLLNLADAEESMPQMPLKTLDHSVLQPRRPENPKQ